MGLDWRYGFDIIAEAHGKVNEDKAWNLYISKFPLMNADSYMSFEDFYAELRGQPEQEIQIKDSKDLLAVAHDIRSQIENQRR